MKFSSPMKYPDSAAIFDIQETEQYYVLSVDLPGLPDVGLEIRCKDKELKVIGDSQNSGDRPATQHPQPALLRCKLTTQKMQAYYQEGILWILLSKELDQICTR